MNLFKYGRPIIFLITIFIGVGLTTHGLMQQDWSKYLAANNQIGILGYASFLIAITFLIAGFYYKISKSLLLIFGSFFILIPIINNDLMPLLAVLLYGISSLCVGNIIIRSFSKTLLIKDIYKLLIGMGVYASLVGLSVHAPINMSWLYFLVLFVPVFIDRIFISNKITTMIKILIKNNNKSSFLESIFFIGLGVLLLLHYCFAFLPEFGHDALAKHLFVPAYIATHYHWEFNPSLYVWTFMPMLADWNYTIGYIVGGETGARLINIGFIFIIIYLIRELILWMGGSQTGVVLAALIFLSTPLVFTESTSLFDDSVWASYLVAGAYWIIKCVFEARERPHGIMLASLFLGFSIATKSVTLVYLPALLLPLLFSPKIFSASLRPFLGYSILLSIVVAIYPYCQSYWVTGNPVFPFYNAYFQSPFYPAVNFTNKLFNSAAGWDTPYSMVFASSKYIEGTNGTAGFQWVMLLLPVSALIILFKNQRAMVLMLMGVLSIVILFRFQSYLRYALPVFAFFTALIGVTIGIAEQRPAWINRILLSSIIVTIALNLLFFNAGVWSYRDIPVLEALKFNNREKVLTRSPMRLAVKAVNTVNVKQSPVVFLSSSLAGELSAHALFDTWYNPDFNGAIRKVDTPEAFLKLLNQYQAEYVILSSYWIKKYPDKHAIIEQATNVISTFSNKNKAEIVELRKLK